MATPKPGAITVSDLQALLRQRRASRIIDVRSQVDYEKDHIPRAEWVPLESVLEEFEDAEADEPIVIYDNTGARSQKAAKMLADAGFANVKVLAGGFRSWLAADVDMDDADEDDEDFDEDDDFDDWEDDEEVDFDDDDDEF